MNLIHACKYVYILYILFCYTTYYIYMYTKYIYNMLYNKIIYIYIYTQYLLTYLYTDFVSKIQPRPACAKLDSLVVWHHATAWSWHRCSLAVSRSSAMAETTEAWPSPTRLAVSKKLKDMVEMVKNWKTQHFWKILIVMCLLFFLYIIHLFIIFLGYS